MPLAPRTWSAKTTHPRRALLAEATDQGALLTTTSYTARSTHASAAAPWQKLKSRTSSAVPRCSPKAQGEVLFLAKTAVIFTTARIAFRSVSYPRGVLVATSTHRRPVVTGPAGACQITTIFVRGNGTART